MSGPSFFRPAPLTTLAVILLILGCSADAGFGDDFPNQGGFGFGGSTTGGGITEPPLGGGAPGAFDYSHLCGLGASDCVPSFLEPACVPGEGGAAGLGGAASGGEAASGGASVGSGGAGDGGYGGGATGTGGSEASYGCQIATTAGDKPAATCDVTGSANIGAVCSRASDCSAGLGCVLNLVGNNEGGASPGPAVGLCRPYCCGDLEECPPDTFCAPSPLFDASAALDDPGSAIEIPVCAPIEPCPLLGKTCGEGLTCSIVRADGDTSCVPIGDGTLCNPCPCAEGYVCSFSSGTCQKLCDIQMDDCPGEGAICQGGSLPNNPTVGLCVLGDSVCQ